MLTHTCFLLEVERITNYSFTYVSGALTITPKPTTLTWVAPADATALGSLSMLLTANSGGIRKATLQKACKDIAGTVVYSV